MLANKEKRLDCYSSGVARRGTIGRRRYQFSKHSRKILDDNWISTNEYDGTIEKKRKRGSRRQHSFTGTATKQRWQVKPKPSFAEEDDGNLSNLSSRRIRCQQPEHYTSDNIVLTGGAKLEAENAQLREDVALLKRVIYRLNVELERCQTGRCKNRLLSRSTEKIVDKVTEKTERTLPWGCVDDHALGPLFNAYEENLAEQRELVARYEREIDTFSERCNEIASENERLYRETGKLKLEHERYTRDMEAVNDTLSFAEERNNRLTGYIAVQKRRLREIQSLYQRRLDILTNENEKLREENFNCQTRFSDLSAKYEILSNECDKLRKNAERTIPVSVHIDELEDREMTVEELQRRFAAEKKRLIVRIARFQECLLNDERRLATITAENIHLKSVTAHLKKNLRRARRNARFTDHALRRSFKRETRKAIHFCKELLSEYAKLLMDREFVRGPLSDIRTEALKTRTAISSRRTENIQESGSSAIPPTTSGITSRRKIAEICDFIGMHRAQPEYRRELQRLKELLNEREMLIGRLREQKRTTRTNLELVWKVATSNSRQAKGTLETIHRCI